MAEKMPVTAMRTKVAKLDSDIHSRLKTDASSRGLALEDYINKLLRFQLKMNAPKVSSHNKAAK